MLLEELMEQRADAERASRPSCATRSDGREPKKGAPNWSNWNNPGGWATPGTNDWRDPSTWHNTDDFLNAWRAWKHQDRVNQFGEAEAERMRREEEAQKAWHDRDAEE